MSRNRTLVREEAGISIVDLLIGMMLSLAVLILATGTLTVVSRAESTTDRHSQALSQLRTSSERVARELRQAPRVYSDSTARSLHVWIDYDQNGLAEPTERVTYRLEPATCTDGSTVNFVRATDAGGSSPTLLAENIVCRDIFQYRRTGQTTFHRSQTTLIRLALRADIEPGRSGGPRDVVTEVRLRNVR